MSIEVLKEKENVYLGRKELDIEVKHSGSTPPKSEIMKELASKYSVPEENVILDYIVTKKGTRTAVGKAKIYKEKPKIKVRAKKAEGDAAQKPKEPAKAK